MTSHIGKHNLDRDKNVLGDKWFATYGGWFSDEENIRRFVDAVKSILPDKELEILYVASASGLLAEKLLDNLGKGRLTIVDISQTHLDQNKNPLTEKIVSDLLEMDLGKKFDLIIMRSSLDYFPSIEMQKKVLGIVKKHLKEDGLFVNQPAYISFTKDRDAMSRAYNSVDKIGKRFFQSEDLASIYSDAGFETPKKIGEGKIMEISEQDHVDRYGIDQSEIKIVQEILKGVSYNAEVTKNGYRMRFEFPIFVSRSMRNG